MIRDFRAEDLPAIQKIHEQNAIDYVMPDLRKPLFIVTKVREEKGVVRAALGSYIQVEYYLWLDKSDWATPEEKHEILKELDKEVTDALWLKGIDQACLWLPPGMDRFGQRLEDEFGFSPDREGWRVYSKLTGAVK